jgi:cytochrome c
MDSFELNKLIGALLGVVFIVFSVSLISDAIFSPHAPETPGYAIEVVEAEAGAGGEEAPQVDIAAMLQVADAGAGEAVFRRCASCHTIEEGGANRVGPNLWDIVNHPVATREGFSYSAALREFSEGGQNLWNYEDFWAFLAAPRSFVPGTTMAFAGLRNPEEKANLIAYLREQSNDPQPLPEPTAEEPAGAAETDAQPAAPDTQDDGTSVSPEADPSTVAPVAPVEDGVPTTPEQRGAEPGQEAQPVGPDPALLPDTDRGQQLPQGLRTPDGEAREEGPPAGGQQGGGAPQFRRLQDPVAPQ